MEKGNTALILNPFIEGLQEGGAEVELFYTRKLDIKPCRGDIACWVKTPGVCAQEDDMRMLIPKLQESKVWVFATPLYMDGMTGSLKTLIDRLIPLAQPFMELHEGRNCHLMRDPCDQGKLVLVANCGFWELENFDPLCAFMKALCKNVRRQFAGALLRPHGPAMRFAKSETLKDVFALAREAGRALASSGEIPPLAS